MTTDVLIVPQVQFRRELGDLWRQTEGVVVTAYSHPWAFFHPIDRDNGGKLLAALRTARSQGFWQGKPHNLLGQAFLAYMALETIRRNRSIIEQNFDRYGLAVATFHNVPVGLLVKSGGGIDIDAACAVYANFAAAYKQRLQDEKEFG